MSDVILKVRDLSVAFGGVKAVNEVAFDLHEGEILGVIGPNGAGKTTTFDAISGFAPSTGTVHLRDVELSALTPDRRSRARLGRSFQDARLFPSLTVSEALAVSYERYTKGQDVVSSALRLPWVRRSERKIKARVDEIIGLMGLGAFYDKFISELSTGSRRIVDLAATMIHDPLVLLLDEPSSGIAQREAEALGPVLLRMREQTGVSILLIEHDMPLITSVSDELLALEQGAVLMRGRCQDVLDDPRVVASYLGTDVATVQRSGTLDMDAAKKPDAAVAADPVTSGGAKGRRPARTRPLEVEVPAEAPAAAARTRPAARKAAPAVEAPPAPRAPARKAPARRAAVAVEAPVASTAAPARKAPARKAPARKAPARTAPAADAPARRAPARKAPARKVAAQEVAAVAAPARKVVAKAPARKAPARNVAAREAATPVGETPARTAAARKAPSREAPAAKAAPRKAPARKAPAPVARVIPLRPEGKPARTRKSSGRTASEDVS